MISIDYKEFTKKLINNKSNIIIIKCLLKIAFILKLLGILKQLKNT